MGNIHDILFDPSAMQGSTRSAPLTQSARAALAGLAHDELRRGARPMIGWLGIAGLAGGITAVSSGAHATRSLVALLLVLVGALVLYVTLVWRTYSWRAAEGQRMGVYTSYSGPLRLTIAGRRGPVLHLGTETVQIAVLMHRDVATLAAVTHGTALYVAAADLVLAVYDDTGLCRYRYPGYAVADVVAPQHLADSVDRA